MSSGISDVSYDVFYFLYVNKFIKNTSLLLLFFTGIFQCRHILRLNFKVKPGLWSQINMYATCKTNWKLATLLKLLLYFFDA